MNDTLGGESVWEVKKGGRFTSRTIFISTRPPIIKVTAPIAIIASLNIIAVRFLSEGAKPFRGLEIVRGVNNLNIPEVTCFPKPFLRETTTAHLSGGVPAIRL